MRLMRRRWRRSWGIKGNEMTSSTIVGIASYVASVVAQARTEQMISVVYSLGARKECFNVACKWCGVEASNSIHTRCVLFGIFIRLGKGLS